MSMKALAAALFISLPLFAAQSYHLELQASPAATFPYLKKFGDVEIHVYASGVRTNALWLFAFSKNGTPAVTVANPLGRMYVEVPLAEIAPTLTMLAGAAGDIERAAVPTLATPLRGKVNGIAATRHRLVYGPSAWIDLWTTNVIPENAQFRAIVTELVAGISPQTAPFAKSIRGMPILVTLNFRRFKNVELLKVKKLTFGADVEAEEKEALALGRFYFHATMYEKVLGLR